MTPANRPQLPWISRYALGTIQLAREWSATAPPVSREDVAAVTVHALAAGIHHRVIGFVGGAVPIEEALLSG